MALFQYVARDTKGRITRGTQEAFSQEEAIRHLQDRGLIVVTISLKTEKVKGAAQGRRLHPFVTLDDKVLYCRQLATLLNAGIPLLRSLSVLSQQIQSKRLYLANESVRKDVEGGSTFKDAIARFPNIFTGMWLNLVETGELSGQLPSTMSQMADYLEMAGTLKRKVVSALVYPMILILVVFGIIAFFILKVVPRFEEIFREANVAVPFLTTILISISAIVRKHFLLWIILVLVFGFLIYRYIKTPSGRMRFDRLRLRLPIFGALFKMQAEEEFASGLSVLIKAGVPILYALEVLSKTASNRVVGETLGGIRDSVREGKSLAEPLIREGIFSPMLTQMVAVGEEAGQLPNLLDKVSKFLGENVDAFVTRLATIIEPLLIIVMAGIVLFLGGAMYMPIFQMLTTVR